MSYQTTLESGMYQRVVESVCVPSPDGQECNKPTMVIVSLPYKYQGGGHCSRTINTRALNTLLTLRRPFISFASRRYKKVNLLDPATFLVLSLIFLLRNPLPFKCFRWPRPSRTMSVNWTKVVPRSGTTGPRRRGHFII